MASCRTINLPMKHRAVRIGMRVKPNPGAFPVGGADGVVVENDGDPPGRAPLASSSSPRTAAVRGRG